MTITYSILLQTVSLEITPAEMQEIHEDIWELVQARFLNMISKVKEQFSNLKEKIVN